MHTVNLISTEDFTIEKIKRGITDFQFQYLDDQTISYEKNAGNELDYISLTEVENVLNIYEDALSKQITGKFKQPKFILIQFTNFESFKSLLSDPMFADALIDNDYGNLIVGRSMHLISSYEEFIA